MVNSGSLASHLYIPLERSCITYLYFQRFFSYGLAYEFNGAITHFNSASVHKWQAYCVSQMKWKLHPSQVPSGHFSGVRMWLCAAFLPSFPLLVAQPSWGSWHLNVIFVLRPSGQAIVGLHRVKFPIVTIVTSILVLPNGIILTRV